MRMRPIQILLLALATGVAGTFIGAAAVSAFTPGEATVAAQPRVVTRGAILMLGPRPHIHVNGAHTALGSPQLVLVAGLGRSRCYAEVRFDQNPGEQILNISATPDARMAYQGITVGSSGGNGRVFLRLYRTTSTGRRTAICANDVRIEPTANVWLMTTVVGAPDAIPDPEAEQTPAP